MDKDCIPKLIALGGSAKGIAQAQARAKKVWPPFPSNGCAANLGVLLGVLTLQHGRCIMPA